jgi:flagellar protein FlaG
MINSLTNTQAMVIEKYRKLEKEIKDIDSKTPIKDTDADTKNSAAKTGKKEETTKKSKTISDLLNEFIKKNDVKFDMVKDEDTEEMILVIRDNKTDEIIKQIPSEVTLKIGKYIEEKYGTGQLTNEKI